MCLGAVVMVYAASRSFLLGGFIKLEQTTAHENVQRVLNALDQDFAAMDRFTYDRASTDETYNGMSAQTPELLHWLMGADATGTTQTQRFNFIFLIDTSARIVASRGYDPASKRAIDIPESLKAHISTTDPLIQSAATNGKMTGVLLLPEGPLLVVSRPIIRPNTEGPIRGFMLSARYLESGGDFKGIGKDHQFFPLRSQDRRGEIACRLFRTRGGIWPRRTTFTSIPSTNPFWAATPCCTTFTESRL